MLGEVGLLWCVAGCCKTGQAKALNPQHKSNISISLGTCQLSFIISTLARSCIPSLKLQPSFKSLTNKQPKLKPSWRSVGRLLNPQPTQTELWNISSRLKKTYDLEPETPNRISMKLRPMSSQAVNTRHATCNAHSSLNPKSPQAVEHSGKYKNSSSKLFDLNTRGFSPKPLNPETPKP